MNASDKKPADAAHIGGVLTELLKHFRPETEQGMLRIWRVWDRVVGADIARNARPAAVKGSLLLVHVTSSTWLHHLQYQKVDLLARLNEALGQAVVGDIKFKIGSF
jgi:predicted nucleic acid-binding Zn ribbon protein